MRIAHVLPLVSDDSSFGGPVSVAIAQSRELLARGHDVRLFAGWRGPGSVPEAVEGIPATMVRIASVIRRAGPSGLRAPRLSAELRRWQADAIHLHTGRHLIPLTAARSRTGVAKVIVQTHGMVGPSTDAKARAFDGLLTFPVLRRADKVLALTDSERRQLMRQLPGLDVEIMINGLDVSGPLVSGARDAAIPEILYVGRLHRRKRPVELVRAAGELKARGHAVTTTIVGPDEGERRHLTEAIAALGLRDEVRIEPPLKHAAVPERMARATIFALPSIDEPFPMSLLEALSVGTPIVCTDSCGLAPLLTEHAAGGVITADTPSLVTELERLLTSPDLRAARARAGLHLLRERLSIQPVADRLEQLYGS